MLESLKLRHVGPAPRMELELAPRLNLLTGDNGLGKSFLLDIIWWALTRKWPNEMNSSTATGFMARPQPGHLEDANIELTLCGKRDRTVYASTFDRQAQAWTGPSGRPVNPGLVLYAQGDGGFSVWDPARNFWWTKGDIDIQDRAPGYVFTNREVWDGLEENGTVLCNGLIRDWASWQNRGGEAFHQLAASLEALSPSADEILAPGELTRISLDDVRDIPSLRMIYGQDIPVLHASAGIRRITALAYLLVWSWQEHLQASKLLGQEATREILFLIDEAEAHLHPRWQRAILRSLLRLMETMTGSQDVAVQLLVVTHSPLVLASAEPLFDETQDAWFDLDLQPGDRVSEVVLRKRPWIRRGDASSWLTSEAFGSTTISDG